MNDIPTFELGIDREALISQHTVSGVKAGSAAFEAGLRDGQQVTRTNIYWNDVSKPVQLTVRTEGGSKTRIVAVAVAANRLDTAGREKILREGCARRVVLLLSQLRQQDFRPRAARSSSMPPMSGIFTSEITTSAGCSRNSAIAWRPFSATRTVWPSR